MGKKHFSDDKADRRGGRSAGGPGNFGGNSERRSSDRGNDRERGGAAGGRPTTNGAFGRPATNGAFGRPATNGAFGRPERGGFGGGERRSGGAGSFGGGERKASGGPSGFGNRNFGGGNQGGGRPFERRDERPRMGKEQRSGTGYGRSVEPRPERGSFGGDRERSASSDRPVRPVQEYKPRENWNGQPYRQEGRPTVPRGEAGERNRKFQKQNPYEQPEQNAPAPARSENTDRNPGFGRSAPRDEERGTSRPIRMARPFEANPPQPREERGDRSERRDEAPTFERKHTPGAFGRRDGAPRSTGEQPGGYERRSNFGAEREGGKFGPTRPSERAPLGTFAQRREDLKAQERSVRRSGTGYGSKPDVQANRADKPRFGEKPGEAPDYKNLKHYEADKNRGNKRRRQEDQDFGGDELRLNRYIANAGICSRREADALIAAGEIRVNGEVMTEMGYKVQPTDTVQYGKTNLSREKSVYVLLNKPKDFITTTEDPEGRRTVMDLVAGASKERIFPVGRLDRNTTGLLLFTNDGEVAQKLSHPSHKNKKIYQVELSRPLTEEDLRKISEGLELEDGKAIVDDVAVVAGNAHFVGIEIHIGRNRIVRRIFEHLGYEVVALDRVQYAGLTKKDLPRGKWRFLSEQEVIRLKYFM